MKNIIAIILTLLLMPLVNGLVAGEEFTIFEGECVEVLVNITLAPQEIGNEYMLTPECTEESLGNYKCLCPNNKTTLKFKADYRFEGNYTARIEVFGYREEPTAEKPWEINTTNPTDKNITKKIELPNNIVIDRVIPPGETLTFVETKEDYVIIPEFDVILDEVITTTERIDLVVTSSGYKCFDIYTAGKEPSTVSVNGTPISFAYNNNLVNFCTNFSTKSINLVWSQPATQSSSSSGGSSKTYILPKKTIKKGKIIPKEEPKEIEEPEETEQKETEEPKEVVREQITEEKKKNTGLIISIVVISIVIIVGGILLFTRKKEEVIENGTRNN